MIKPKRIALFIDIENLPLAQEHINQVLEQLDDCGKVVYAKLYGASDRKHKEIITNAVEAGFEIAPSQNPGKRPGKKIFDYRIAVDVISLVTSNLSIDGVAIIAKSTDLVYLLAKLRKEDIAIYINNTFEEKCVAFADKTIDLGDLEPVRVIKVPKRKKVEPAPVASQPEQEAPPAPVAPTEEPAKVEEASAEPVVEQKDDVELVKQIQQTDDNEDPQNEEELMSKITQLLAEFDD